MSQIRRRRFLLASGALLVSPNTLAQQREKAPVVGVLHFTPSPAAVQTIATRFRELGWVEGKNIHFVHANAEGKPERLDVLAEELVQKRVDVIVARGPSEAVAAARKTKTIPIVFIGVGFPVEMGLVASLAKPGGNVTGVAWIAGGQVQNAKPMEFLRRIAPNARRLALISTASQRWTVKGETLVLPETETELSKLGFERQRHRADRDEDFEAIFAAIFASSAQAIGVYSSPLTVRNGQRIVDFIGQHRLPSAFDDRFFVDRGGLVSYGPLLPELRRRGVEYVDRVLRGARPADLPVELPPKYELAVNLRAAKEIGVTVPQSVLLQADRVVE